VSHGASKLGGSSVTTHRGVPLPGDDEVDLSRPDRATVDVMAAAVVTALGGEGELTELQRVLIGALFRSMTEYDVELDAPPVDAEELARLLARRNEAFRVRVLQIMILCALVVRPLQESTVARLDAVAEAMSVGEGMLTVARDFATGSLGLAAVDFERNGYTSTWDADRRTELHTAAALHDAWQLSTDDPALAARWQQLESLPEGTLGRRITEFYRARGFEYPGRPGSAPPLLAQHDWVHVLADYGSRVESELEVFAFIARANDDPKGFSLLAMVVSLFETGYLASGAGLFEAFPGQLSQAGVATRLADAMRRGALVAGSIDFMNLDWFSLAHLPVDELRQRFGITAKSRDAINAGSVGPWEPGGISPFQLERGQERASANGVPYRSFGASL
jgi:hypothetical protein